MLEKIGIWIAEKVGGRVSDALLKRLEDKFNDRLASKPPTDTLRLISIPFSKPTWYYTITPDEGQFAQILRVQWAATNITSRDLTLVIAHLREPPIEARPYTRGLVVQDSTHGVLPPHEAVRLELWFEKVLQAETTPRGQPIAGDVVIIDQYGNEYQRDLSFEYDAESDNTA
jgi:hypothetical protein